MRLQIIKFNTPEEGQRVKNVRNVVTTTIKMNMLVWTERLWIIIPYLKNLNKTLFSKCVYINILWGVYVGGMWRYVDYIGWVIGSCIFLYVSNVNLCVYIQVWVCFFSGRYVLESLPVFDGKECLCFARNIHPPYNPMSKNRHIQ